MRTPNRTGHDIDGKSQPIISYAHFFNGDHSVKLCGSVPKKCKTFGLNTSMLPTGWEMPWDHQGDLTVSAQAPLMLEPSPAA